MREATQAALRLRQEEQRGRDFAATWAAASVTALDESQHRVGKLARVFVMEDFVSPDEEAALFAAIDASPQRLFASVLGRQVAVLGGYPVLGSPMTPLALPWWMAPVRARLLAAGALDCNHVLLNRYAPGCGLKAHFDGPLYEPRVAILSLCCHAILEFVDSADVVVESVLVPRRSLLVFDQDAYTRVRHRVPFERVDVISPTCANGEPGRVLERTDTRVSLTMRRVLDVQAGFSEALMSAADRQELRTREASFLRSISE